MLWLQLSYVMHSYIWITNYNVPFSFPGLGCAPGPATGWCSRRPLTCWWDGSPSRTDISFNLSQVSSKASALRLCSDRVDIVPWRSTIRIWSWSVFVWPHDYVYSATNHKEKL
jgi:hypothetical protein